MDEELDWGDDDQPAVVDAWGAARVDDDQEDVVSLGGADDYMQEYVVLQQKVDSQRKRPSPPKSPKPTPVRAAPKSSSRRSSATKPTALTKSPPAGLPPKPVDSMIAPYVSSSDPSLTSASAMSSVQKPSSNALSPEWEVRHSRNGGGTYYYNVKTYQSTWTRPPELSLSPKAASAQRPPLPAPLHASLPPRPMPFVAEAHGERRPRSRSRSPERPREVYPHRNHDSDADFDRAGKASGRRPRSPRPARGIDSYRPDYSPSPERRGITPPPPVTRNSRAFSFDPERSHNSQPTSIPVNARHGSNVQQRDRARLPSPPPPSSRDRRSHRASPPPAAAMASSTTRQRSPPQPSQTSSKRSRSPFEEKPTVARHPYRNRDPSPARSHPRYDDLHDESGRRRTTDREYYRSPTPPPVIPQKRPEKEPDHRYNEYRPDYQDRLPRSLHPDDQEHDAKRRRTEEVDPNSTRRSFYDDGPRSIPRQEEDVIMGEDTVSKSEATRRRGPPLPSQEDRFRMAKKPQAPQSHGAGPPTRPSVQTGSGLLPPAGPRSGRPASASGGPRPASSLNSPANTAATIVGSRPAQRDASHPDFANQPKPPPSGPAAASMRGRFTPGPVSSANSTPLGGAADTSPDSLPRGPRAMNPQTKPRDDSHHTSRAIPSEQSRHSRPPGEPRDVEMREMAYSGREPDVDRRDPYHASSRHPPRGAQKMPISGPNNAPIGEVRMRVWGQSNPDKGQSTSAPRPEYLDESRASIRANGAPSGELRRAPSVDTGRRSISPPNFRSDRYPSAGPPAQPNHDARLHRRSPSPREDYNDYGTHRTSPRSYNQHPQHSTPLEERRQSLSPPPVQRRQSFYERSPPPAPHVSQYRNNSPPTPPSKYGQREARDSRMDEMMPHASRLSIQDDDYYVERYANDSRRAIDPTDRVVPREREDRFQHPPPRNSYRPTDHQEPKNGRGPHPRESPQPPHRRSPPPAQARRSPDQRRAPDISPRRPPSPPRPAIRDRVGRSPETIEPARPNRMDPVYHHPREHPSEVQARSPSPVVTRSPSRSTAPGRFSASTNISSPETMPPPMPASVASRQPGPRSLPPKLERSSKSASRSGSGFTPASLSPTISSPPVSESDAAQNVAPGLAGLPPRPTDIQRRPSRSLLDRIEGSRGVGVSGNGSARGEQAAGEPSNLKYPPASLRERLLVAPRDESRPAAEPRSTVEDDARRKRKRRGRGP